MPLKAHRTKVFLKRLQIDFKVRPMKQVLPMLVVLEQIKWDGQHKKQKRQTES